MGDIRKVETVKRAGMLALCLAVMLSGPALPLSSGSSEETLDSARRLTEARSYDEALQAYQSIESWLSGDPGLMIEWARVYTYADRHGEAIRLFEKIRREFPEREREIIRELADQYKWNGDKKTAVETYRRGQELDPENLEILLGLAQALAWDGRRKEALRYYDSVLGERPEDLNILFAKAEVLSWGDKLERAEEIYREIAVKEPGNTRALIGSARMNVWQGYHRKGIRLYEKILEGDPGNAEAMEGLAYGLHWAGDTRRSLRVLRELLETSPGRDAAKTLFREIQNNQKPHIRQTTGFSHDSNKLSIFSESVHAGGHLTDTTALGVTYEFDRYRQQLNNPVKGHRMGFNASQRFGKYVEANSYWFFSRYDCNRFSPWTTNTWLTLKPSDILRFDMAYDRVTFEDIKAIHRGIITDSGSISCDLRPNRFWFFSSKYQRTRYNDRNDQNTVFSRVEYRLRQDPYLKLYYNHYYSDWSEQRDNGYFNPYSIHAHSGGLYGSRPFGKRLFLEAQFGGGYEKQHPKSNHPTFHGTVGIRYRISPSWVLSLRGEYFDARDANQDKSYLKKAAWIDLVYSFGAETDRPHRGQAPQRPLIP